MIPENIYNELDKVPPYQKEGLIKNYIGLEVKWLLFFVSITHQGDEMVRLLFKSSNELDAKIVACVINIEQYPKLKIIHKETKVLVLGKVSKIDPLGITLEDVKLDFLEQEQIQNIKESAVNSIDLEIIKLDEKKNGVFGEIRRWLNKHPWKTIAGSLISIVIFFLSPFYNNFCDYILKKEKSQDILNASSEITSTTNDNAVDVNKKLFVGSIFQLINRINDEQIQLNKEKLYQDNKGLLIKDNGQYINSREVSDDDKKYIEVHFIEPNKYSKDDYSAAPILACWFKEGMRQSVNSLEHFDVVNFKGVISGQKNYDSPLYKDKNTPIIFLSDCEIVK